MTDTDPDATARRLRAMTRVRKLMRLADDQQGKPEGDNARRVAEALLVEHGLSRTAVDLGGEVDFRHRSLAIGPSSPWRRTLMHAIADYFDCVALYEKDAVEAQIFGPEPCLPQVEYTFTVYLLHLRTTWQRHVADRQAEASWNVLPKPEQLRQREAFCTSFVLGARERLEADRARELRDEPGEATDTARQRRDLERWMRSGGVRWRADPRTVAALDRAGYQAGLEADVEPALRTGRDQRRLGG